MITEITKKLEVYTEINFKIEDCNLKLNEATNARDNVFKSVKNYAQKIKDLDKEMGLKITGEMFNTGLIQVLYATRSDIREFKKYIDLVEKKSTSLKNDLDLEKKHVDRQEEYKKNLEGILLKALGEKIYQGVMKFLEYADTLDESIDLCYKKINFYQEQLSSLEAKKNNIELELLGSIEGQFNSGLTAHQLADLLSSNKEIKAIITKHHKEELLKYAEKAVKTAGDSSIKDLINDDNNYNRIEKTVDPLGEIIEEVVTSPGQIEEFWN